MDLPSLVATVLGALKAMTIERGCTAAEAAAAKSKALNFAKREVCPVLKKQRRRMARQLVLGSARYPVPSANPVALLAGSCDRNE